MAKIKWNLNVKNAVNYSRGMEKRLIRIGMSITAIKNVSAAVSLPDISTVGG